MCWCCMRACFVCSAHSMRTPPHSYLAFAAPCVMYEPMQYIERLKRLISHCLHNKHDDGENGYRNDGKPRQHGPQFAINMFSHDKFI